MLIGLTGGIGCGKSTVFEAIETIGAYTIDADKVARQVLLPGMEAHEEVLEIFGKGLMNKHGEINRAALAEIVFNDERKLYKLNRIIHPHIDITTRRIIRCYRKKHPHATIFHDISLLFENNREKDYNKIIVVDADFETRIERVMQRDGLNRGQVITRMDHQLHQRYKKENADYIITNNGSKEDTHKQAREVVTSILDNINEGRR